MRRFDSDKWDSNATEAHLELWPKPMSPERTFLKLV
jgi:hypothetical protein